MDAGAAITDITDQYAQYVEMLDLRHGDVVLEAGCGAGRALAIASKLAPFSRWVGLDRLRWLLDQAYLACPQTPLVLGHLSHLPFGGESFDAVFSRDTLECLLTPAAHLDECARVLRPGGRLLVSHWDWDTQVFNCADLTLTRGMVRAYADTPQGWMEHHDPAMGRKLHGLVSRQPGLRVNAAGMTVLVEKEWRVGRFGYEQSQTMAKFLPAKGVVSEADAHRWLEMLEAAARSGDYLFSANHYWCLAQKRNGPLRA